MLVSMYKMHDERLATFSPLTPCLVCSSEPEIVQYFTRTYTRKDGTKEIVRVGYWCHCGGVVIDGMVEGSSISFPGGRYREH